MSKKKEEEEDLPPSLDEPDIPMDLQIPEPKGFKNLPPEYQNEVNEKMREAKKIMQKAAAAREEKARSSTEFTDKPPPSQEREIMGKYMLRDMPLFKYEFIIYLGVGVTAFMLYFVDKIGISPGILSKAIIPAVILPLAIWLVKRWFYMPSKYRVPAIRIYKSGIVELGVQDIRKGYVKYGSGDNTQRKYITKLNKHTEASTGKPFLVTSETQGENLSLIEGSKPDMRSEEFNAILETNTAVTTKNVMNKMLKSIQPSVTNPMFILGLITLFGVAIILIRDFGFLNFIKGG